MPDGGAADAGMHGAGPADTGAEAAGGEGSTPAERAPAAGGRRRLATIPSLCTQKWTKIPAPGLGHASCNACFRWATTVGAPFKDALSGAQARQALDPVLVYMSDGQTAERFGRRLGSEVDDAMEREFVSAADARERRALSRLLLRQLERRFGVLPPEVQQRIEEASKDDIERWALRVVDAPSLDDVLGSD